MSLMETTLLAVGLLVGMIMLQIFIESWMRERHNNEDGEDHE